jgi:ribulose-phosphate 3-epimerase
MSAKTVLARLREMVPTISVGMLTADLLSLGSELRVLEQSGVQLLHVDVMDGCFVPLMTFGPPLIKAMKTPLLKDVHLMVQDPMEKATDYVAAGADMVTVHVESSRHIHRVLQTLGKMANGNDPQAGIVRGIALNPGTPVEAIEPLLEEIDMVFLLAINPGWGGQKFLSSTPRRIGQVKDMAARLKRSVLIGVDGGVTRDNIGQVARMGADIIVTGSAVFDGQDPAGNARFMLNAVK